MRLVVKKGVLFCFFAVLWGKFWGRIFVEYGSFENQN